jgi:hypothetical protein
MMNRKKALVGFLLLGLILAFSVGVVEATSMSFTVPGGEETTRTINLAIDDRVLIRFTVTAIGQTANTLNFSMTYPNGTVKDFGKTGEVTYSFVCDKEGEYVLHFSNTDSTYDKLVTLNYEVDRYIFGMPQMLFLVLVIAVICVAGVAVFILMGKPR